ncbi:MAG: prepilin-type N-terminal cleavage/methylation domain-containing protein, partial [Candidatus Paceibacterota bacterium]
LRRFTKAARDFNMKAFTLLELLITLGISAMVLAVSWPLMTNIYLSFQITSEVDNLIAVLRKAQSLAFTNQDQSPYGVYILESQYLVFKGSSYAGRDPTFDEKFAKPSDIIISGLSEVVFTPLSGVSNATGTFDLSNGRQNLSIQINDEGTINY